jgi:hypothetical protein
MKERPANILIALLAALAGAFVTLYATAAGIDIGASGLATKAALGLLSAVLFLAVAGSLYANGQWTWRFLIFMEALCAIVPISALFFGAMPIAFAAAAALLALVAILMTAADKARSWIELDRI